MHQCLNACSLNTKDVTPSVNAISKFDVISKFGPYLKVLSHFLKELIKNSALKAENEKNYYLCVSIQFTKIYKNVQYYIMLVCL